MDLRDWLSGIFQCLKPWQRCCSKMFLLCGLDIACKTSLLQMLRDDPLGQDPSSLFAMKEELTVGKYTYTLHVDVLYIRI